MKVLVTGATGFIGSALMQVLLKQGHDISIISRQSFLSDPRVRVYKIDMLDSAFDALDLTKFDVIFNCAGELKDNTKMAGLHIDAPLKMLSLLKGSKCRWVQLSSVGVYGMKLKGNIHEETPFSPEGCYEVTKAKAEQKIVSYCRAHNINYSILRPSNVIGIGMPNNSMRSLVKVIAQGRFFYMASPSKVQMNFVHVDNVVDALLLCGFSSSALGNAFNISDSLSQKEFVDHICNVYGRSEPKVFVPAVIVKMCVYLLGWLPKFPFSIAAINALTTRAKYSTKKIESQLGFVKKMPLSKALDEFFN